MRSRKLVVFLVAGFSGLLAAVELWALLEAFGLVQFGRQIGASRIFVVASAPLVLLTVYAAFDFVWAELSGRASLRVERGKLVLFSRLYWSVDLDSIKEVRSARKRERLYGQRGIIFALRNGDRKFMPTKLIVGSNEDILDFARSALSGE